MLVAAAFLVWRSFDLLLRARFPMSQCKHHHDYPFFSFLFFSFLFFSFFGPFFVPWLLLVFAVCNCCCCCCGGGGGGGGERERERIDTHMTPRNRQFPIVCCIHSNILEVFLSRDIRCISQKIQKKKEKSHQQQQQQQQQQCAPGADRGAAEALGCDEEKLSVHKNNIVHRTRESTRESIRERTRESTRERRKKKARGKIASKLIVTRTQNWRKRRQRRH